MVLNLVNFVPQGTFGMLGDIFDCYFYTEGIYSTWWLRIPPNILQITRQLLST